MLVTFAFTQPTPTTRNIPHHGSSLQLWCRSEQTSKASWLCWSSGWSVSTARLGNTACKWARERRQWSNDICWEEGDSTEETGRGLQLLPTSASVRCARICLTNQQNDVVHEPVGYVRSFVLVFNRARCLHPNPLGNHSQLPHSAPLQTHKPLTSTTLQHRRSCQTRKICYWGRLCELEQNKYLLSDRQMMVDWQYKNS